MSGFEVYLSFPTLASCFKSNPSRERFMSRFMLPLGTTGLLGCWLALLCCSGQAAAPTSTADQISAMVQGAMIYPHYMGFQRPEEGVVLISFTVGKGGGAEDMKIIESSGHEKLDRAALRAMASLHHLPTEAEGRHSIGILEYRLDEDPHGNGPSARVAAAITRLQDRLPDMLVPTRYLR